MEIEIDPDVKAVAEFMQSNIPAARLVSITVALYQLAPILWGRYGNDDVHALRLEAVAPIGSQGGLQQSTAI
jgi:hypothetical protein